MFETCFVTSAVTRIIFATCSFPIPVRLLYLWYNRQNNVLVMATLQVQLTIQLHVMYIYCETRNCLATLLY